MATYYMTTGRLLTDEEIEKIKNSRFGKELAKFIRNWLKEKAQAAMDDRRAELETKRIQNISHLKNQLNDIFNT